jgi:two-component system, OmpR family, response regulator
MKPPNLAFNSAWVASEQAIAGADRVVSGGTRADCDQSWRAIRVTRARRTLKSSVELNFEIGPTEHDRMKRQIAIVEDEPAIRDNYAAAFTRNGYAVRTYGTRKEAIEAFRGRLPDLAVIDVGLRDEPEGGFELCRELRSMSAELPIIFLTARDSELDAVSGLRLGADDYLTKDLSLTHLIARVTALFRRIDALTQPSNRDQLLGRGDLLIDAARLHATWRDKPLGLTLTEFWIVHALAKNPGHVKNRQQLMDAANVVLDDNTITSHIKRIRRKFQAIDASFDHIETMYGMGYRWKE